MFDVRVKRIISHRPKKTLEIIWLMNVFFPSFYNDKRLLAEKEKYSATMLQMEKFYPQKC